MNHHYWFCEILWFWRWCLGCQLPCRFLSILPYPKCGGGAEGTASPFTPLAGCGALPMPGVAKLGACDVLCHRSLPQRCTGACQPNVLEANAPHVPNAREPCSTDPDVWQWDHGLFGVHWAHFQWLAGARRVNTSWAAVMVWHWTGGEAD